MSLILTILAWGALILGLIGAGYALFAASTVARFFAGGARTAEQPFPPVTLLKPLAGAEPGLREALESFCRQAYGGAVQIVFGVLDPADPAIAVVEALKADHPDLDISLVADPSLAGLNLKVCNLIHMVRAARHELLVLSDSDITVPPDYLARLAQALAEPKVGMATCLYLGQTRAGLWSRLSAMGISYQFLPNVLVGRRLGLAEPSMGSTIALSRTVLDEIGGFEAFANHLADDYEIGRAVRAKGYRIALPTVTVDHGCVEKSAGELISHEIRWGRTIRLIDGAGYFGAIVTHGFPLALIGAALTGFSAVSVALVLAILLSRLILKTRIDAATGTEAGSIWLMPLRDVLSFVVFLASLTGASVTWRGRRYRVGPDGVLTHF